MKKIGLLAGVLLWAVCAQAQETDSTFTYDRPGVADSPYLIPVKNHQVETGFEYYKREGSEDFLFFPVIFYRTGITKNAELRVSTRYKGQGGTFGLGITTVGAKLHIIDEKGARPEVALLTNLILPYGKKDFVPEHFGHDIVLAFQNNISPTVGLNYNIGSIWENFAQHNVWTYSICGNFAVSKKTTLFAEHYAFIPNIGDWEFGFDGGIMYCPKPTVQFDLSAGISRSKVSNYHQFATLGVAFRIR